MLGPDMDLKGNDVYTTLSTGWSILTQNFKELMIFYSIPVTISILFSLLYLFSLQNFSSVDSLASLNAFFMVMGGLFAGMIGVTIIQLLFTGGLIGMTKEAYETGVTEAKTGFSVIKKYPLMIIATGIIVQILVSFGACLCLIPGLLFCYWWLFALPAVVIEGKGVSQALSASKNFASRNKTLWFTIVIFLIVIIGVVISSLISLGVTFPFNGLSEPSFGFPNLVRTIVSSLLSALIGIYFILCVSVHYMRGRITETTWDGRVPAPPMPIDWSQLPDQEGWEHDKRS